MESGNSLLLSCPGQSWEPQALSPRPMGPGLQSQSPGLEVQQPQFPGWSSTGRAGSHIPTTLMHDRYSSFLMYVCTFHILCVAAQICSSFSACLKDTPICFMTKNWGNGNAGHLRLHLHWHSTDHHNATQCNHRTPRSLLYLCCHIRRQAFYRSILFTNVLSLLSS